eukprot:1138035-Pelagomonas_calceolata.AAC.2
MSFREGYPSHAQDTSGKDLEANKVAVAAEELACPSKDKAQHTDIPWLRWHAVRIGVQSKVMSAVPAHMAQKHTHYMISCVLPQMRPRYRKAEGSSFEQTLQRMGEPVTVSYPPDADSFLPASRTLKCVGWQLCCTPKAHLLVAACVQHLQNAECLHQRSIQKLTVQSGVRPVPGTRAEC